ncbi:hypothetical protein BDV3_004298 [Batrachochytrium dendrobatidis]|uniref:RING-type E3 ubiquitin transferase (cysteine targeting) n=1 Tax=Batrachochytrium dendrobatidis (strain JEL423) TaxID=403673 RepID=A0A177WHN2_BATDL|nr:peroxisome assembly protein (Peroxin-2) [Batrachochytrium dendrobatidis]KAK5673008.1 peroxisome assembly protein (Peroxin-2) [Batrachochytrium dendrobatidis]OAJ38851.1 hypothetical protein BDEG_22750 [Batrachochytrium dendrobatidis JEL423]
MASDTARQTESELPIHPGHVIRSDSTIINSSQSIISRYLIPSNPFQPTTTPNVQPMRRLHVLRSSQLDADLLNNELKGLLSEQVTSIFSMFKTNIKSKFEPEINAILEWLISESTLYASGTTYALQLQNLVYRNERQLSYAGELSSFNSPISKFQKTMHAILNIGGTWIHARLARYMTKHRWSDRAEIDSRYMIWKLIQRLELAFKIVSVTNFLVFLYSGRYRSLLDRLLGMRVVYFQKTMSRMISFEFMNRQLVWHTFTEFLLFIIPFININAVKRALQKQFTQPRRLDLPPHLCVICHIKNSASLVLHVPYQTNCGHIFCYYCIKTEMMMDASYACPRCGVTVKSISRYANFIPST